MMKIKQAVPSWVYIKRLYSLLSHKSFHLAHIVQLGIASGLAVPNLDVPENASFMALIALVLLLFSDRLMNVCYPVYLVADQRNYFAELASVTTKMKAAFSDLDSIEKKWRAGIEARIEGIDDTDAKITLNSHFKKAFIFPDITEYKPYFESICSPTKQSELNYENTFARLVCVILLYASLALIVSSIVATVSEFWIKVF